MKITIETIPHGDHRYNTVGDYWWDEQGNLQIRVSDTGNWKYEALVALHEMAEVLLLKERGIAEPDVMAFDINFEKEKAEGKHAPDAEPGAAPNAPYAKEHFFAEALERLFALQLGVHWETYDKALNDLYAPTIQPSP